MATDPLQALRREPESAALLLDVDGTLAPVVPRPADAAVPAAVRELLGELGRRYGLVACVSGRQVLEARRVVGLDALTYVGNHGLEVLRPGADEPQADPAAGPRAGAPAALLDALAPGELDGAGLRREDKGAIQALHWRGASDEAAAEARARELADRARAAGLVPRWGRKVLELRPVAGVDKGSAVDRLLAEHSGIQLALYAGDDRTDLDAFRALRRRARGGRLRAAVCVGVTSEEGPAEIAAEADLTVADTDELAGLLRELAA